MILRTTISLLICILSSITYAESNILDMFEEQRKESVAFNKGVTDEEIIEYFEVFLKFQPKNLKDFRSQTPKGKAAFLKEYRKSHTEAGIKIPILRGLSEDEMQQFEEIAKYKASESIRIESAKKRLLSFSNDQYRLMLAEAVKLISKYDEYEKEDHSNRVVISKVFPEKLAFLNLESIYLSQSHCELLLQNGVGRDIGYGISQDKDGSWKIKYFDHYESWESNRIDLDE